MYVWNDQICDGRNDCIDGEDEKQCNTCEILLLECYWLHESTKCMIHLVVVSADGYNMLKRVNKI